MAKTREEIDEIRVAKRQELELRTNKNAPTTEKHILVVQVVHLQNLQKLLKNLEE